MIHLIKTQGKLLFTPICGKLRTAKMKSGTYYENEVTCPHCLRIIKRMKEQKQ